MKICPKCGKQHEKRGAYCCQSCANSRKWSEDHKRRLSTICKNSEKVIKFTTDPNTTKRRVETYKKTIEQRRLDKIQEILLADFDELKMYCKKIRIFHEQGCACNRCKNTTWQDQNIPLELEHIDGNNQNHNRENLELLCPNCHALTDTWRGRNRKNNKVKKPKVTDDQLLTALINNDWVFRRALIEVGLVAKGSNYNKCHKIKRDFFNE